MRLVKDDEVGDDVVKDNEVDIGTPRCTISIQKQVLLDKLWVWTKCHPFCMKGQEATEQDILFSPAGAIVDDSLNLHLIHYKE